MASFSDHLSKIITAFFIAYLSSSTWGQSKFEVVGLVVDKDTQLPIEYASISMHLSTDSVLQFGTVTDSLGRFQIAGRTAEDAYLIIQFLGYQTQQTMLFRPEQYLDLGKFDLVISSNLLSQVEISGQSLKNLQKLQKQVFTADQFSGARGGTALDVLKNVPSVSVNALGEISIRGATGFLLMIDGKPSQSEGSVLLNQIAANNIDDVEIITTPSSKYDPDGHAGIIHIKTKKGLSDGLSVTANSLLGAPSIEAYNNNEQAKRFAADFALNWRKDRWDISLGADYRRYDVSGKRVGYVNTYQNQILTEYPSYGERSFDRENYSGRFSVRHRPNNQQEISLNFFGGKRTQFRTADILYDKQQRSKIAADQFLGPVTYWQLFQKNGTVISDDRPPIAELRYFNENLRVRKGDFVIGSFDYEVELGSQSNLRFSALYERTVLGGPTYNTNLAYPNLVDTLQSQFNDNDNPLDGFRTQLDYTTKLGTTSWQSGYQFRHLKHPGNFIYQDRNLTQNTWDVNPLFTNDIELTRNIHSLYSDISEKLNRLEFSAGLRLEYFDRSVEIARPDTLYKLDRLNLFPSLNLKYDLGSDWSLKAGYSKRIERTTTFKMTPFPEREHSETLEQGDAVLLPEYIDLLELGLSKNWKDHSAYATVYFRNIENVINRVNTIFNDSILNRIYTNAGRAEALGLDFGTNLYPTKNMHLFFGSNIYNYKIRGNLFGDAVDRSNTVFAISTYLDLDLAKCLNLQLGLNYLSERLTAQGQDDEFYNPYLSLRKTFLDEKLSLTLQWLNIDMGLLSSNEQSITTTRSNFFTTTNYIYEVDIIQLNINYQISQKRDFKLIKSEFGDKEF